MGQVSMSNARSYDLAEFPPPSGREEVWRFAPRAALKPLLEDAPSDGRLRWETTLSEDVTLTQITSEQARARAASAPVDRISALAAKHADGAMLLDIPADSSHPEPIVLDLVGVGREPVTWGQVLIDVGAGAKATVVLRFSGAAQYAGNLSVVVGDNASLELVSVQNWSDDSVHAGHFATRIGRDARLRSVLVTLGGEAVRLVQTVDYDGPGGDADIRGLFFADAGQRFEHRSFVDHSQPHCRSNVVFKGALQGERARSVWVGDVLIRANAVGTQTYEINRNLLLDDGPRADSVPNLEILTGDVAGAGHASATGRFDEEQVFYLRSRGISEEEARRLVVLGFFADVLDGIDVPMIRAEVMRAVEAELGYRREVQ
ncbi:MAG TPA: Fe-S cluster assembly protein SufD [Actinomycetota bacterium]|jgi:Fe-S cluster assembly protein SufD|nr:Fe-S cluster assembly protein SufD [Actinomycetota bacterium]HPQ84432.1 Fe-S cluster assembly protein SufD [Actinomycetota bacterium]